MPRYIDADNFRKTMIKRFGCIPCLTDYSEASRYDIPLDDALDLAPTADVAEVVRCKDCKYFEPDESTPFGICICKNGVNYLAEVTPHKEHFCSYGERKE